MSSALAMHTGDAFAPPSDQSRPKYEAAHWRYTHGVAHKKPDAAAGCAGWPSRRCDGYACMRACQSSKRGADARAPMSSVRGTRMQRGARHTARPGVQASTGDGAGGGEVVRRRVAPTVNAARGSSFSP